MLPLPQVEQGHYRRFLVLTRIAAQHLLNEILIGLTEFEGYRGIVVVGIAMLDLVNAARLVPSCSCHDVRH